MTDIASLGVKVDTSQVKNASKDLEGLTKAGARAEGSIASLARSFGLGGGIAAAAFATASGIALMTKNAIDNADAMNDMAKKTGIAVETMGAWQLVAEQSGASMENLAMALKAGSKYIVENSDELKKIGIEAKTSEELIFKLAGVISSMDASDPRQVALAMQVLGDRVGQSLLPMLQEGEAGLRKLVARGKELNPVTSQMAAEADKFKDQLAELNLTASGLGVTFANQLLPSMNDISRAMVQAAQDSGLLMAAWVGLGGVMAHGLGIDDQSKFNDKIEETKNKIALLQKQINSGSLNPSGASDKLFNFLVPDVKLSDEAKAKMKAELAGLIAERDRMLETLENPKTATKPTPNAGIDKFLASGSGRTKKPSSGKTGASSEINQQAQDIAALMLQFQQAAAPAQTLSEKLQSQLDAYTAIDPAVKSYLQGLADQVKATEQASKAAEEWARQNELASRQYEQELAAIESASQQTADEIDQFKQRSYEAWMGSLSAAEQLEIQIEEVRAAAERLGLGSEFSDPIVEQMKKASDSASKTADEMTEFWRSAAENMQTAMSNLFFDAMQGDLGDLEQSFKATLDRMVANLLASQLTTFLFGADFGKGGDIGGLVADAGKWIGENLPSFDVGTPYVPQDMIAKIHKGEKITPAKDNKPGMGGNVSITMHINTPDANSFRKSQTQIMADAQRQLRNGMRVS